MAKLVSDADQILFRAQHGVAGLAAIVQAVMETTQPAVLAKERKLWISLKMRELGVDEAFRHYPYTVAFDYDGDIELRGHSWPA